MAHLHKIHGSTGRCDEGIDTSWADGTSEDFSANGRPAGAVFVGRGAGLARASVAADSVGANAVGGAHGRFP